MDALDLIGTKHISITDVVYDLRVGDKITVDFNGQTTVLNVEYGSTCCDCFFLRKMRCPDWGCAIGVYKFVEVR